jgi:predicted nucleotidyltransferase
MDNRGQPLPGTEQHQALLRALGSYYEQDRRVRALIVFGSLVRGDWDSWSDLDLDVILADGVSVDVLEELEALQAPLSVAGEKIALILPDGPQEGDLVLESLMRLSIRYHFLAETSPNILDSMWVLVGSLGAAAIVEAGLANRRPVVQELAWLVDRFVYYGVIADICLRREQTWTTVEILHRMRNLLMELYAQSRGAPRAYKYFDIHASVKIKQRIQNTLHVGDLSSLHETLFSLMDIVEADLAELSNNCVELTIRQATVLAKLRRDG